MAGIFADNNGKITPQGYIPPEPPDVSHPSLWDPEPTAEYIKGLELVKGNNDTYTLRATMQDDTTQDVGTWTAAAGALKSVSITNDNGIYTFTGTTDTGETAEIGTVEVPVVDVDNLLAEINDSIVENTSDGYDFHTLTETENNGTKNEVGKFYLARNQITKLFGTTTNNYGYIIPETVDQDGIKSTGIGYTFGWRTVSSDIKLTSGLENGIYTIAVTLKGDSDTLIRLNIPFIIYGGAARRLSLQIITTALIKNCATTIIATVEYSETSLFIRPAIRYENSGTGDLTTPITLELGDYVKMSDLIRDTNLADMTIQAPQPSTMPLTGFSFRFPFAYHPEDGAKDIVSYMDFIGYGKTTEAGSVILISDIKASGIKYLEKGILAVGEAESNAEDTGAIDIHIHFIIGAGGKPVDDVYISGSVENINFYRFI